MLSKDQVLAVRPKTREIEIPEWGGSVFIRPLTEEERAKFATLAGKYDKASGGDKIRNVTFPVILWAVCDEQGNPFFSDLKEVAACAATSPSTAFVRLQDAIFELSAFTKESREAIEKNLPAAQNDGLSSD